MRNARLPGSKAPQRILSRKALVVVETCSCSHANHRSGNFTTIMFCDIWYVDSENTGPQHRPQHAGTPKMVPMILGNHLHAGLKAAIPSLTALAQNPTS